MSKPTSDEIRAMRAVNVRQKSFYEIDVPPAEAQSAGASAPRSRTRRNLATRIWRDLRHGVGATIRHGIGIDREAIELHRRWLGDLTGKRVLDLGCHTGNPLSLYLAEESGEYLGVDLSETAIQILREKIGDIESATAVAVDFLDDGYPWGTFDVIYARSVVHHFQFLEPFLDVLRSRLADGGVVVTYDPLSTALPVRIIRTLYRPFQGDAEWEWPLDRDAVEAIEGRFTIDEIQGFLGKSKWAIPLCFVNKQKAVRLGRRWHQDDLRQADRIGTPLFNCMHVAMRLTHSSP